MKEEVEGVQLQGPLRDVSDHSKCPEHKQKLACPALKNQQVMVKTQVMNW